MFLLLFKLLNSGPWEEQAMLLTTEPYLQPHKAFHNNEICVLLAAQSTSEKVMSIKETPYGVYFLCGKS